MSRGGVALHTCRVSEIESIVTPAAAAFAASSRDAMSALLARVAMIARPGEGCPHVLFAIALLAHAEWVEGSLRVELAEEHGATRLDVFAEHAGIRERVLPTASFPVALEEFVNAVRDMPALADPLIARRLGEKLVLSPASGTVPPPQFEVEMSTAKRTNPLTADAFRSGQVPRFDG